MMDHICANCKYKNLSGGQHPCCECKVDNDKWEPIEDSKPDPVNHPTHYADSCSLECIDVMELTLGKDAVIDFCLCNAFKYIWRCKHKNGAEDIAKAKWYLNKVDELGCEDAVHDAVRGRLVDLLGKIEVIK